MEAKYAFWECISDGVEKYNQAEKKTCSERQLPRTKGNLFMETNKWWEENINLRDKDRKIRNRKSMLNRQNVPSEEYTGLPKDWRIYKKDIMKMEVWFWFLTYLQQHPFIQLAFRHQPWFQVWTFLFLICRRTTSKGTLPTSQKVRRMKNNEENNYWFFLFFYWLFSPF